MVLKEEKREVMEPEKGRIGSGHSYADCNDVLLKNS